jgi:hypothetical protein
MVKEVPKDLLGDTIPKIEVIVQGTLAVRAIGIASRLPIAGAIGINGLARSLIHACGKLAAARPGDGNRNRHLTW